MRKPIDREAAKEQLENTRSARPETPDRAGRRAAPAPARSDERAYPSVCKREGTQLGRMRRKPGDAEDVLGRALHTLKQGIAALTTSEDWKKFLEVSAAFHNYSFNNWMLIFMQMPHATRVAGYKTWLKLKRQVRKGEKSIRILAPMPKKFTAEVEKRDPSTGEVTKEQEERSYIRYRAVPVFDLSQTDGEVLPELTHELQGSVDEDVQAQDLFSRLESYAFQSGFAVEVKHISGAANGYMDPTSRLIVVDTDLPILHRAKTLAHECAHMILHADLDAKFEHSSRSQQEVEAESVAFCLLKAFGLDSSLCSFGYVAGWSGGDPQKVTEAGQNIQKAFHQLLDAAAPTAEDSLDEAA